MHLHKKQVAPAAEWLLSHGAHIHRYPARSVLAGQGSAAESLFYLLTGSVTVYIRDEEGQEMILAYLNPGDFFGEAGLFDDSEPVRRAGIRARTVCEVVEVPYARFRQWVKINPDLLLSLSAQTARRLKAASEKAGGLAFVGVTGRIAQALLLLARQPDALTHPEGMQIRVTRQDIGLMVGCSRETVGRVVKMMDSQGLISARGKTIVVFGTR